MKAAAVVAFFLVLLLVVPPPPLWTPSLARRMGRLPRPTGGEEGHSSPRSRARDALWNHGWWVQSEIRIWFWFECIDCGCGRLAPCVRQGTDSQSDFCASAFDFWLRHRFPRLYEQSFTKAKKQKQKGPRQALVSFLFVVCRFFFSCCCVVWGGALGHSSPYE